MVFESRCTDIGRQTSNVVTQNAYIWDSKDIRIPEKKNRLVLFLEPDRTQYPKAVSLRSEPENYLRYQVQERADLYQTARYTGKRKSSRSIAEAATIIHN